MRRLRYILRLTWAFLSRFKAIILIGTILGVIFFTVLSMLLPKMAIINVERVGLAGRYSINNLPVGVQNLIGEGLTAIDESGNVKPGLAESWNTPDGGKTWIFTIREGAIWQDGKKLLANELTYQFSDADISYPDERTISFSLESPYSAFPSVVSKPSFRKGLLGTGAWKVKKLSLVSDFVDKLTLENADGKKIMYRFYPTEERAKLAFKLGEVDSVKDILDPKPLNEWPNLNIETNSVKGEYVAIFFNTDDKLLSDKTLRQALSYATQKDRFGGARATGPIPSTSWAYNPQVKPYAYDPAKAKSMINAMPAEVKNNLEITLTTTSLLLPVAEMIHKDWEQVGIKAKIQVMSDVPQEYQALLAIFDAPEDPDQYTLWHSTQSETNITRYNNPRIDKLLEDGRTTTDQATRKQIYLDFQRFLLEDSPAMFLYYPSSYTFTRN